ncbi:C13 family peptidase [Pseudomarimonas salicorniae]|uniref:C13 family peptidase n=1 Tax=Pseudomarimonas salicorniae TaxID=2933270 RepID=A0ABT0GN37_9GAMM|nr:C13 family peptidase [Lysobacter sp. CAU 1642]MCK7595410.1 C13 family peptidase [Lysobacter sp. CAU 1642]
MSSAWTEQPVPARGRGPRSGWIAAALQLAVLRRPRQRLGPGDLGRFAVAAAIWLLAGLLLDDLLIDTPRVFSEWALTERSFPLLLALAGAALVCALLRRSGVALGLASIVLLALLPGTLLWIWVQARFEPGGWLARLPMLYLVLFAVQLARWAGAAAPSWRRGGAALSAAGLLLAAWMLVPDSPWWWTSEPEDDEAAFVEEDSPSLDGISAEQLWQTQPDMLDAALARLAPQRPDNVDLYVLALAGDGNENVFRNEVGYVRRLAEQRLGAKDRVLSLVNHPDTLDAAPIASVSNLRRALQGLARVMDTEEDLLWLFMTSHGSEDHQLYLGLDPLPLDWLDPATLRQLLEEAGIRWRVIVVSACYSGGFIEPLRDEHSLLITAARADRPSFGCGVQSQITWFGEAFLVEALNQGLGFDAAYREARRRIREREREEEERPSYPQIALGQAIAPRLEAWRATLGDSPRVEFETGMPVAPGGE